MNILRFIFWYFLFGGVIIDVSFGYSQTSYSKKAQQIVINENRQVTQQNKTFFDDLTKMDNNGFNKTKMIRSDLYLGQIPPGNEPKIFVPDSLRSNAGWWWHNALAFTPDGQELYMDIYVPSNNHGICVRYMKINDNKWTSPQVPSFAESYGTASPSFTDNGNKVFFISDRPNGYLWTSIRTQSGWSTPDAVSFPWPSYLGGGWEVSVTQDETLYLRMQDNRFNTDLDIYRVRKVDGSYTAPERLDDTINSPEMDLSPYIDPDENFLIFESVRSGGYGSSDLYICFKKEDDSWTPAINMGASVNSSSGDGAPFVSADGLFLFFNSDRHQQWDHTPYWVSAQVIEELKNTINVKNTNDSINLPIGFQLYQNYPNPFNSGTTIPFKLNQPANVSIKIYNIKGELIKTIVHHKYFGKGMHFIQWNGNNNISEVLSSGVYIFQLTSQGQNINKKMIFLR